MEYEELGWLIDKLSKQKEKTKTSALLDMSVAVSMGNTSTLNKKGAQSYRIWSNRLKDKLQSNIGYKEQEETLFDKLKKNRTSVSVFKKLRRK